MGDLLRSIRHVAKEAVCIPGEKAVILVLIPSSYLVRRKRVIVFLGYKVLEKDHEVGLEIIDTIFMVLLVVFIVCISKAFMVLRNLCIS